MARDRKWILALLALVFWVKCASSSNVTELCLGGIDNYDTCHLLQECWEQDSISDVSGCPTDWAVTFPSSSTELSDSIQAVLTETADEIESISLHGGLLRSLNLVGVAAVNEPREIARVRASVVRDELVALGVSPSALVITEESGNDERGYVRFEVLECDPVTTFP